MENNETNPGPTYAVPLDAIVLAGDISLAQASELVTKHFGTWSGGAAAAITIPPAPAPKAARAIRTVETREIKNFMGCSSSPQAQRDG